ncbi:MAG: hypothetical protein IJ157_06180 [Clostridia bacterium]|nr:hypothetical protein [Clostridia bacterium]
MNDQDTVRLLRECDAGAKMGVASIDGVIESVKNEELHSLLQNSKQRHEQLGDQTARLLSGLNGEGKEPSVMAKGMSGMKIGMKMMLGNPDQQAADLITDGCNMGVKSLCKYLNQYPAARQDAKDIANRLIGEEEHLAHTMRPFL